MIGLPNSSQHHGTHPARHRTEQIRKKTSLPPKSPRPSRCMRLQLQKPLPHERRQLTKHNSLGPSLPLPAPAPNCRNRTQSRMRNPGPITPSHACPLTQLTTSPQKRPLSSSLPLTAQNTSQEATKRPARHIAHSRFPPAYFLARRSDMQANRPNQPPRYPRTESAALILQI